MSDDITGCDIGWSFSNGILYYNGQEAERAKVERGLAKYEREGCACGKGLECPLMVFILESPDDDDSEEENWPEQSWDDSQEISDDIPLVKETLEAPQPYFDGTNGEEELEFGNQDLYDFTEAEVPAITETSFNEEDLVNDVFQTTEEMSEYEEPPQDYVDAYEAKVTEITNYANSMASSNSENRVLREKLEEMEQAMNQQLREVSLRQKEFGRVEKEIEVLKTANTELIWSTLTCLKILKFLPDSHKMNFRNSNDFKKMLDIYKVHIEPKKKGGF